MEEFSRRQFVLFGAGVGAASALALAGCANGASSAAVSLSSDASAASAAASAGEASSAGSSSSEGASSAQADSTSAEVAEVAGFEDEGVFVTSFAVMSDMHIMADNESNEEHFRAALSDVASYDPAPCAIVFVGDITDDGFEEQYELVRTIVADEGFDFGEDIVKVMGNHEIRHAEHELRAGDPYDEYRQRFADQCGQERVYYDVERDGQHFICLGSDECLEGDPICFNFSDEQLAWLDDLLADDYEAGRFSFVFMHEPVRHTVRDTFEGGWAYGASLEDPDEFLAVIGKYPNAVLFTGHSHVYVDYARPDEDGPLYVNDWGVATGCTVEAPREGPHADWTNYRGAFGLLVDVYENRIVLRARDYLAGEWVEGTEYVHRT